MSSVLDQLPDSVPWVTVDTETSGLHPDDGARVACAALTWPEQRDPDTDYGEFDLRTLTLPFDQGVRDKIAVTQLRLEDDAQDDPNLTEADWKRMLEWLVEQPLVMHNAKFDCILTRAGTRHWPGVDLSRAVVWDTMLAQGEIEPTEPRGLDAVTRRLGLGTQGKQGVEAIKGWLKANKFPPTRYDLAPWDIVRQYVGTDTELTADLYIWQQGWLKENPDGEWVNGRIERELRLLRALYAMEVRGVGYDAAASEQAARQLEETMARLRLGFPFDPDVKKQVAGYFVGTMKLEPERRTEKKGDPQIDEEQLREWIKEGVIHARELDDYNKCKRAVSMWYRGYAEKMGVDGRLRTTFRQGHVKSGRMSVERVQLQAMPKRDKFNRDVFADLPQPRNLLVPKEDYAIWTLDLSQAELRVASRYAGCKNMLRQLADGEDIHSNTCMETLDGDPDADDWKELRDIAKRLTFGGIFQIGGEKFQATLAKLADIHWPLAQCEEAVRRWRQLYPEFGQMYYKSMRMADRQKWVPLLKGTPFEYRSWFGERDYPQSAWNRVVQGSLAEGFKQLLIGVEENWPGYLILTVHDSTYLECPIDEGDRIAAEVAEWAAELMTGLFHIDMKMDIDRPKELIVPSEGVIRG